MFLITVFRFIDCFAKALSKKLYSKICMNSFPGISELAVSSTMETMSVLERGSAGRVTGSTAMNQASSRSHAVFTIVIAKESRSDKYVLLMLKRSYIFNGFIII